MRLTREQVNNLEDGTVLTIFLSGREWDEDFGKAVKVIKVDNRLIKYDVICNICDIDSDDSLDIQAAIKEDI
jgi:hypothetical protein